MKKKNVVYKILGLNFYFVFALRDIQVKTKTDKYTLNATCYGVKAITYLACSVFTNTVHSC